ncbi:MAG: archease [Anaerolineales bacterium]|nr:archease [Anaerolineales bacterium]
MRWEEVEDHTADTGLKVWGKSPEECILGAVIGFINLTTDPKTLVIDEETKLDVETWFDTDDGPDVCLHDVLNWLLYDLEVSDRLPVAITTCEMAGEFFVLGVHHGKWVQDISESRTEIKAITWQDLTFEMQEDGGWYVYIIFDI